MNILLHPTYFPNSASCAAMSQSENISFEVCDNYQKQTYRNRAYIYAANGRLALQIPVKFSQNNRQLYKDVKIANDGKWQAIQWKSLQSAYKTSPYFEFYEDDLAPLFHSHQEFVMDFNFKCLETIADCLQWELKYGVSTKYDKIVNEKLDLRGLVDARKEKEIALQPYTQVFSDKHGYLNNLSILDVLFNEGTNALNYLQSQPLELK